MQLSDRNFFVTQALYSVIMHFSYVIDKDGNLNENVARNLARSACRLADITMEEASKSEKKNEI